MEEEERRWRLRKRRWKRRRNREGGRDGERERMLRGSEKEKNSGWLQIIFF